MSSYLNLSDKMKGCNMRFKRQISKRMKNQLVQDVVDDLTDVDVPQEDCIAAVLRFVPKWMLIQEVAKHCAYYNDDYYSWLKVLFAHIPVEKLLAFSPEVSMKYGRRLTKKQLNYVIKYSDTCFGRFICDGDKRRHCRQRNYCAARYSEQLGILYVWDDKPVEESVSVNRNPKRQRAANQDQHGEMANNRETGSMEDG